ncbi:hypothetical protein QSO_1843 [Clostridioides difficile P31]|nr:hypothetical protein QK3_2136 [Clostridioides difficile DA00145]EQI07443.1 hypothetical protein QO5_2158 [Clostridioides difficile F253]EQK88094.1 hypothetical protein QSO_1843 [Clostridioides difficile P31]
MNDNIKIITQFRYKMLEINHIENISKNLKIILTKLKK